MKKHYYFLLSLGCALSTLTSVSCTSIPTTNEKQSDSEITELLEEPEVQKGPSEEELYINRLQTDLSISLVSEPGITNLNKAFSKPYTFSVKHQDGSAYKDFELEFSYPSSKNTGVIEFTSEKVKTDEEGLFSFTPNIAAFSADSFVSVKPSSNYDNDEVKNAELSKEVKASYKVRSDVATKGAILFVWDYNENNRPANNSYNLQSEFRKRGITNVGNAPISDNSYIGKPLSSLYKANYEIIDDSFGYQFYGYLICGSIKFVKPVEADGDAYVCSLVAEITGLTMKDGSTTFSKTFTHEARGKNWSECTGKCKEELAKMIVDALVFGL